MSPFTVSKVLETISDDLLLTKEGICLREDFSVFFINWVINQLKGISLGCLNLLDWALFRLSDGNSLASRDTDVFIRHLQG